MVHLALTVIKRYQVKQLGSIRTPPAPSALQQPPFFLIIMANYTCQDGDSPSPLLLLDTKILKRPGHGHRL